MFSSLSSLLGIPYNWLTKLLWLGLLAGLWQAFVAPQIVGFSIFINYVLNLSFYKFFPESSIIAFEQLFILLVTWRLLLWMADPGASGPPSSYGDTPMSKLRKVQY